MFYAKFISGVPCFYAHFTGVRLTSQQIQYMYIYMCVCYINKEFPYVSDGSLGSCVS